MRNGHAEMSQAIAFSSVADRFIRLYENTMKKCEEEEEERGKKRRWREWREVKDSREKEFMETYISSLKDRGAFRHAEMFLNICGQWRSQVCVCHRQHSLLHYQGVHHLPPVRGQRSVVRPPPCVWFRSFRLERTQISTSIHFQLFYFWICELFALKKKVDSILCSIFNHVIH